MNELSDMSADQVRADQAARRGIENDFSKSLGVPRGECASVEAKRKPADINRAAGLARLLFGESDRGNWGSA
jgi:hypothetical protein